MPANQNEIPIEISFIASFEIPDLFGFTAIYGIFLAKSMRFMIFHHSKIKRNTIFHDFASLENKVTVEMQT